MCLHRILAAFGLAALATAAQAASLTELFERVPPPPSDVATALSATQDGKIVAPELAAFRGNLAAERAAVAALNGGAPPVPGEPPGAAASAPVELQRIAQGYGGYLAAHSGDKGPKALLGKRTRWVQKAMGQQQARITQGLKACATPCTDASINEHNQAQLQRRAQTLGTELEMWGALFRDWQSKRSGVIADAEHRIAAAGDAALDGPEGRAVVARYRAAMLDEIDLLFSITELAVTRAPVIDRGIDGSEPDSISGATRKSADASRR